MASFDLPSREIGDEQLKEEQFPYHAAKSRLNNFPFIFNSLWILKEKG
jgi:hypothetical protein